MLACSSQYPPLLCVRFGHVDQRHGRAGANGKRYLQKEGLQPGGELQPFRFGKRDGSPRSRLTSTGLVPCYLTGSPGTTRPYIYCCNLQYLYSFLAIRANNFGVRIIPGAGKEMKRLILPSSPSLHTRRARDLILRCPSSFRYSLKIASAA